MFEKMMSSASESGRSYRQELLRKAKDGKVGELGNLLNLYTNYLKVLAQSQLDRRVRSRLSPSDLVQDTLMEAHRDFAQFRGDSFLSWSLGFARS